VTTGGADEGTVDPCMATPDPALLVRARGTALLRTAARKHLAVSYALLATLGLALLVAFVAVPYLPMVDLPQHAAQLSIWVQRGEAPFLSREHFTLNLSTPYVGAYLLARGLAPWLGVILAFKVVAWLSIALHVVAFALLVHQLHYPRWVAVFGLPLGLGYCFYYGFVSFNFAMPLALFSISAALEHRARCTWRSGLVLAGALSTTLASHGFALVVAAAIAGLLLLRGAGHFFARLAPLCAPPLIALVWLVPGPSIQSIGATVWDPRVIELLQLPALLVGISSADHAASCIGVGLLVLLALGFARPRRQLEMWAPLLLVLAGFCLFPRMQNGFGPLHPRFAAFLVPALLLAFEPRSNLRWAQLPKLAYLLCASWFLAFTVRLQQFAEETNAITAFISEMPAGLRLRPVVFERDSAAFAGAPLHLHLSAYYAALKGGFQGYSFAMYPTSIVVYTESAPRGMFGGAEWQPERFSGRDELSRYDLFWVKSSTDRSRELFGDRQHEVTLVFRQQGFWGYRRRATPTAALGS